MRHLLVSLIAVGLANVVAPLLTGFLSLLLGIALNPQTFSYRSAFEGLALFALFGVPLVFMSIFPVSLILALLGLFFRWRSLWIHAVGGAALGLGFAFLAYDWSFPRGLNDQRFFPAATFAGALCGWVYWRIAITQTPDRPHAIDAA
ncbi:hypothetical protein HPT29_001715 [Microvirga terrae]|uniref:DUF4175 domain-containing protein n=1 Tax=Microvirga terrae TaxID=2740529 RepID=A0ABY5RUC1_9HYPH|nr:hypothetical protein [Microvirga terrae]UVF19894.1 hypothetical protein HPT29_001715 [Microvirga terrae]